MILDRSHNFFSEFFFASEEEVLPLIILGFGFLLCCGVA